MDIIANIHFCGLPWEDFWSRDCRPIGPLCEQWTVVNCRPMWHLRNLRPPSNAEMRWQQTPDSPAISNCIFDDSNSLLQLSYSDLCDRVPQFKGEYCTTCLNLSEFVWICLNLTELVWTCRNLSKLAETCWNLSKLVKTSGNLSKLV